MINMLKNKFIYIYNLIYSIFFTMSIKTVYATTLQTDKDFQTNLNILLTNLVTIFVNFMIGLAIIVGIVAFIVQLLKINTWHNLSVPREKAIRDLLGIVISTASVIIAGLIFSVVFTLITT
ncbi:hypothetical protein [Clostridium sp.]|uniref:hypothetical protein n=1 Tax=Clostridium sp. TaxID=1506 RepID=UPI001B66917B|nr:hypothetical protein [Clostridium sp.]MBP3917191.1 hypothetical protein [Clostridium sp.]